MSMPNQPTLLALFAHPDDECFGLGGTLARASAEGVNVVLVCATRGEVGEIADPSLATAETLGEVREGELRQAAEALGINELVFLDYRDSGMVGTPPNDDPRAFVQVPAEVVVPRVVSLIRRLRPQVVITFDPNGGYGHPDHIAIHHHTVAAFHAAADPSYGAELGAPWQAERLFYVVIPRSQLRAYYEELVAAGRDPGLFARSVEEGAGWPDEAVHAILDVSATVDAKIKALNCHRTQFGAENPFRQIPEARMRELMSRETLSLAWPTPEPGTTLDDLFAASTG